MDTRATVRILVIRRRYVGDIVLLGSVFQSLRERWPDAYIAVAVDRAYAALPTLHQAVDAVYAIPAGFSDWLSFFVRLRRDRFTHALDFDNRPRTALITAVTGAPVRATLRHGQPPRFRSLYSHALIVEGDYLDQRHITAYYHRLLGLLDIPLASQRGELRALPADLKFVAELPELAGLPSNRPRVLVHPGSRSAYRVWPAPFFAAVCDELQASGAASIVMVAGPAEQAIVAAIQAEMKTPVAALRRPLSLPQLAALFASVDLLLCHDSGPMHLAASVGTRVVALFGSQNKANWHPLGQVHITLQPPLPCQHCVSPGICKPDDAYFNHCVRNIKVPEVVAAVRTQLQTLAATPQ